MCFVFKAIHYCHKANQLVDWVASHALQQNLKYHSLDNFLTDVGLILHAYRYSIPFFRN